jgi:hypothetical protein
MITTHNAIFRAGHQWVPGNLSLITDFRVASSIQGLLIFADAQEWVAVYRLNRSMDLEQSCPYTVKMSERTRRCALGEPYKPAPERALR